MSPASLRFFWFLGLVWVMGCNSKTPEDPKNLNRIKDLKTKQYAIAGRELYIQHCSNCHQKDGAGLGLLIPPLKNADYMLENPARSARIIRYGLKGEIVVNGQTYNQPMPGNPTLKSIEIAQLMTYIFTNWGGEETLYTVDEINQFLAP
ncbi:MAG: cytochrome c [Lunatimonas sp.]|uniref:c-type cytochrome n=1 Tax=Lunatimonas sp. TaxID=2060141 RepID=UPI00263B44CA|nr:cytochrome c [Lunatimonas sp.]MCC5938567.1 cytochrome c [Lunatimonas sp.]